MSFYFRFESSIMSIGEGMKNALCDIMHMEQLDHTRDREIQSTFHSVHLKGLLSVCIGLRTALQIIIKVRYQSDYDGSF